jgi:hypothetical protein
MQQELRGRCSEIYRLNPVGASANANQACERLAKIEDKMKPGEPRAYRTYAATRWTRWKTQTSQIHRRAIRKITWNQGARRWVQLHQPGQKNGVVKTNHFPHNRSTRVQKIVVADPAETACGLITTAATISYQLPSHHLAWVIETPY